MTDCYQGELTFSMVRHREVRGSYGGGEITSDGGVLFTALADRKLGLTEALARLLPDARDAGRVTHSMRDLFRQRIYGLAQAGKISMTIRGCARIRIQTAVGREDQLASASTLCCMENAAALHTTR